MLDRCHGLLGHLIELSIINVMRCTGAASQNAYREIGVHRGGCVLIENVAHAIGLFFSFIHVYIYQCMCSEIPSLQCSVL